MKARLSTWNTLILGKWNIDILTPEWVAVNILGAEEIAVDLVMDGMTTNIRYNSKNLTFVPKSGRIAIAVRNETEEALLAMEKASQALLRALPVTPISAAGINYSYEEASPTPDILKIFDLPDAARLSDLGLSANTFAVRRQLAFEDVKLNFMLNLLDSGVVRLGLNYHIEENNSATLADRLEGKATRYQDHSQSLLSELYGLTLESSSDA